MAPPIRSDTWVPTRVWKSHFLEYIYFYLKKSKCIFYQNIIKTDGFVGKVPMVPIGGGPYYESYYGLPPGVFPVGQPQMYPQQFYPSKYPYYNDTVNQVGRPCDEKNGCGVLGACQNGVCSIKQNSGENTVFNMKL